MTPTQENFRPLEPQFPTRTAYLWHCARISLTRRWNLVALALVLGATGGMVLSLTAPKVALLAALLGLLTALAIALNSMYRHANDRFDWR